MSENPKQSKIHPGYAFSTDYTRLLELITGGHEIMCMVYNSPIRQVPCSAKFVSNDWCVFQVSSEDNLYVCTISTTEFIEQCQRCLVQFLDPEKSNDEVERLRADVAEMNSALADLIDERHDLNQEVAELRFQADRLRKALGNMVSMARPHFSDKAEMAALEEADEALAVQNKQYSEVKTHG